MSCPHNSILWGESVVHVIELVVAIIGVYFAIGIVFAVVFVSTGIRKVDPITASSSVGFRTLTLPGTAMLWPIMLAKWIRA